MRVIYALVILFLIAVMAGLAVTFIYLERGRHQVYAYVVKENGHAAGSIRIDRYDTEEKKIFTSEDQRWFRPGLTRFQERLVISKKSGMLEKYTEDSRGVGGGQSLLVENKNSVLNFLYQAGSEFSVLSQPMRRKEFSVFRPDSLISYLPMIDKYDFRKGRSQSFNAVHICEPFMPPLEDNIVLTSIRDEYIDVLGKKTKTEVIVVRSKIYPEARLWVSKADHSIARFEIPKQGLVMERAEAVPKPDVKEYDPADPSYKSVPVTFKSGDLSLSGTLTVPVPAEGPAQEARCPAVLLLSGRDFFNRDCGGIFCDIAGHLAQKGFVVLRYDRRGIGKSEGNGSSASLADDLEDAKQALDYLCGNEEVDGTKVAVVGHGRGGFLAAVIAARDRRLSCVALAAFRPPALPTDFDTDYAREYIENYEKIYGVYKASVSTLREQTLRFIKETKADYASIFGNKVYVKRMLEESRADGADLFVKKDAPVLVLQGKKDKQVSWAYLKSIPWKIVYFRNLDHYFGSMVTDYKTRSYYKIDREVPETIRTWLSDNFAEKIEEKPAAPAAAGPSAVPAAAPAAQPEPPQPEAVPPGGQDVSQPATQ